MLVQYILRVILKMIYLDRGHTFFRHLSIMCIIQLTRKFFVVDIFIKRLSNIFRPMTYGKGESSNNSGTIIIYVLDKYCCSNVFKIDEKTSTI